jgi:ATP:corrinoid adenosyltransferase
MLQIYTGTGKGKTTAALGVALRGAGQGLKTIMFSFLKNDPEYGEAKAAKYLPGFILKQIIHKFICQSVQIFYGRFYAALHNFAQDRCGNANGIRA